MSSIYATNTRIISIIFLLVLSFIHKISSNTIPTSVEALVSKPKKTIYLIRHAETEENIRMQHLKKAGKSILRINPPKPTDVYYGVQFLGMVSTGRTNSLLTENGKRQIEEMHMQLLENNFTSKIEKFAHSPLTRAMETCYGFFDFQSSGYKNVVSLESLREVTPYQTILRVRTPVKRRIKELCQWLDEQEEETIALVGHSEYFKYMLGLKKKFKNCDVWKVTYCNGKWTNLELQYRLSQYSKQ